MCETWKRFVSGQDTLAAVEPVIYRSWQRSRDFQVAPERVPNEDQLSGSRLLERQQFHEELLRASKSVLPHVYDLLHGLNYMVLLADNEGFILDTLGDPPFISKAQQVHLSSGASWREEIKGTNAIGTALTEKAPLKVLGWEHFVQQNHFMACWAAPIRNPQGDVIGVLDISGEAGSKNQRLLDLVIMGARMVEQNLQLQELERGFKFYRQGIKLAGELLREGFIAIDKRGVITEINPLGAQLLGRKPEEIIGHLAAEVFRSPKGWMISNKTLDLQFRKTAGQEIISRLREVADESGKSLGAVGILQPSFSKPLAKTRWVGRSEQTKRIFERAEKAAKANSSVLIQGESGTGKEVVARYIHEISPRRDGPFIALNCAALPHSLVESELFGYAEGAFTGARKGGQPGKFELANGGTIFLDEIGDMPLEVQVSLLRVLQEREVLRIGDTKPKKIDVRVISATHKNLSALVAGGLFRLDLFYRLKVITIDLPPLRDRLDDIWDLVPHFVAKFCQSADKPPMGIDDEVYQCLLAHPWPGNIRELENCIEGMVAMADGPILTVEDLPEELRAHCPRVLATQQSLLDLQTKQAIVQALKQTGGKISPAARLLGIGRNTLYRKIKALGIQQ